MDESQVTVATSAIALHGEKKPAADNSNKEDSARKSKNCGDLQPWKPYFSKSEENCVKSALAFVVMRKRAAMLLETKNTALTSPLQATLTTDSLGVSLRNAALLRRPPPQSSSKYHLDSMFRVAIITGLPLYKFQGSKKAIVYHQECLENTESIQTHKALQATVLHLSALLQDEESCVDSLETVFQMHWKSSGKLPATILTLCRILHSMAEHGNRLVLIRIVCRSLRKEYHNNKDDSSWAELCTVNLLLLLEFIVSLELNQATAIFQAMQIELQDLIIPVPRTEMLVAYHTEDSDEGGVSLGKNGLSPSGKMMLRLSLFGICNTLSSQCEP